MTKEQLIESLGDILGTELMELEDINTTSSGLRLKLEDGSSWKLEVEEVPTAPTPAEDEEDEDLSDEDEDDDE